MIKTPPAPATALKGQITIGLTVSVFLWGLYLAAGAALFNRDIRKGVIVLACTVVFLALWASALWVARTRQPGSTPAANPWNVPCLLSLVASVLASVCILLVALGGIQPDVATFRPAIISSQVAAAGAAILAIVGLSDRQRPRGKWLGIVGLLLVAVTLVVGFWIPTTHFLG